MYWPKENSNGGDLLRLYRRQADFLRNRSAYVLSAPKSIVRAQFCFAVTHRDLNYTFGVITCPKTLQKHSQTSFHNKYNFDSQKIESYITISYKDKYDTEIYKYDLYRIPARFCAFFAYTYICKKTAKSDKKYY